MNRAENVVAYIRSRLDLSIVESMENYGHMGATLADAMLQAGSNYKTVVQPRVKRLLTAYPDAKTTSQFAHLIEVHGASEVLGWSGGWKIEALRNLLALLLDNGIETEGQLQTWLEKPTNLERLQRIKGIKEKTAHYLQILVSAQGVAVDRHLFRFLAEAGVHTNSYSDAHHLIQEAATLLGVESSALDHSIWRYMSERARSMSVKQCKKSVALSSRLSHEADRHQIELP